MKLFFATFTIALLSGCATFEGQLENRVTCTVAKDKALYVSMYGPIGIASKVAEQDAAVLCASAPASQVK